MSALSDRLLLEQAYLQATQLTATLNAIVASNTLPAQAITEVTNAAAAATTLAQKTRKAAQRQVIAELQALGTANAADVAAAQAVLAALP